MSDAKTVPSGQDVRAFIEGVEPERKREEARVLDAMFRKVTGEEPRLWGPSIIGYGDYHTTYYSGREVHWLRTGFSPRKARHSLYLMGGYCDEVTGEKHAEDLARLGKHARGKSCLYVNKLADIDLDVLERMIRRDYEEMLRRYPD